MFRFSNGASSEDGKGSGNLPLGTECICSLNSNLVQIPPCNNPIIDRKGKGPQADPCCCVDLSLSTTCPGQSVCGFDVTFDNNNFNPVCQICQMPPGWGWSQDDNGVFHFDYSGSNCNGAIIPGNAPVHFQFCGYNSDQNIGYTVCRFYCTQDPQSGLCVRGQEICCRHFTSSVNCGTDDVGLKGMETSFSVDAGYPNPAQSSVRFDYKTPINGEMTLTLVDILGKALSTSSDIISIGEGYVTIGLADAQPGVYYCVFDLNGQRITRRIRIN